MGAGTGTGAKSRWRVTKKLLPGQAGTIKLLRRYGEQLLCVRYRFDERDRQRCTTVELVVDQSPLAPREAHRRVAVRVNPYRGTLRATLLERGATWDDDARVWRMPHALAVELGIAKWIVPK